MYCSFNGRKHVIRLCTFYVSQNEGDDDDDDDDTDVLSDWNLSESWNCLLFLIIVWN